jgi:hypothetical protein
LLRVLTKSFCSIAVLTKRLCGNAGATPDVQSLDKTPLRTIDSRIADRGIDKGLLRLLVVRFYDSR